MHFSLFWPRENWGGRKKVRGGGGEVPLLPLLADSISVALAPIFAQPKSEKRLQRAETLATRASKGCHLNSESDRFFAHYGHHDDKYMYHKKDERKRR